MAHTTITIDGDTVLDTDITQWRRPHLPERIHPTPTPDGARPQAWQIALMHTIAEAATAGLPLVAVVDTFTDGWTLNVRH